MTLPKKTQYAGHPIYDTPHYKRFAQLYAEKVARHGCGKTDISSCSVCCDSASWDIHWEVRGGTP